MPKQTPLVYKLTRKSDGYARYAMKTDGDLLMWIPERGGDTITTPQKDLIAYRQDDAWSVDCVDVEDTPFEAHDLEDKQ